MMTNCIAPSQQDTQARFLEYSTCREVPDAMACAYLWDLCLTLRGRVRVFQESLLKGKGKQRASWLAPRSHVDTFVPHKSSVS
ncbi:hypothetical protein K0M31_012816 [Melipona bicolor]|uniref:Uncharacterized protein n=1 Tax=Melipona bicolor TaxID=60889 RepID=A0AA40FJ93_9HYME|nr:hypothetical protein K0M31_012816 [Melipona bicolor]